MRDRLIELIGEAKTIEASGIDCKVTDEYIADHLLANGVVVPPCYIGQKVWFVPSNANRRRIIETTVEKVVVKTGGTYIKLACNTMYETSCRSIGKTVFLTREEAEQALKGGE